MRAIEVVDAKILDAFTRFSHRLQRFTGRTNFFFAKLCAFIVTLALVMDILNFYHQVLVMKTSLFVIVLDCMLCIIMFLLAISCDQAENTAMSSERAVHPLLVPDPFSRIIFLVASVVSSFAFIFFVSFGLTRYPILEVIDRCFCPAFCAYEYFISVNPLPPGKSKVREWIDGFNAFFAKPEPAKDSAQN